MKKLVLFAILAAALALPAYALAASTGGAGSEPTTSDPDAPPSGFGDRTLREGHTGPDVKVLQKLLTGFGLRTTVDGEFGPGTETKVRAYEKQVDGVVDGVVSRGQAKQMWIKARDGEGVDDSATAAEPAESPPATTTKYVFPVRGAHNYGEAAARYGAGRGGHSHQGQDVFAKTGTTVAAAQAGTVKVATMQSAAGNYVVIYGADGTDNVYMHLNEPASVAVGDKVRAGQPIGHVGCTGSCSGPHLHFEVWTSHWYDGGQAVDPLARLKQWDAAT